MDARRISANQQPIATRRNRYPPNQRSQDKRVRFPDQGTGHVGFKPRQPQRANAGVPVQSPRAEVNSGPSAVADGLRSTALDIDPSGDAPARSNLIDGSGASSPPKEPAAEPAVQKDTPSHPGAFGIPASRLDAARADALPQFTRFYARAVNRQAEKSVKSSYVKTQRNFNNADGTQGHEDVWERRKDKRSARVYAWQAAKGKRVQMGLNKIGRVLREKTGVPRKTGSNFGTDKAKEDLLTNAKQVPVDMSAAAQSGLRALNYVPVNYAVNENPAVYGDIAPMADGLTGLAVAQSLADGAFAAEAHLRLTSEVEKAKKDLNLKNDALRFLEHGNEATPEEAENYLKFLAACGKVFEPTQEDISILKAAQDRATRSVGLQPLSSAGTAAIEIANSAVSVTPLASAALAPISIAWGVVDVHEGKHELLRRVDQKARAQGRKAAMNEVLRRTPRNHEDYELLEGLIDCFNNHQDGLVRQAELEMHFARLHIFKGGGAIGGAVGGAAALGMLAGFGVLTAATGGVAAIPPAVMGGIWGGAVAARNYKRVRTDHKAKWDERMVRAIALHTPREDLEAKLAGTAPDTRIRLAQQEGEYLPESMQFAGARIVDMEARDNAYLGLRVLALRIQDLVKSGNYDESSPLIQLVHALGISELQLQAICKASIPKKPNDQLDFIQSQLAPALGMKVKPVAKVAPHVSIFLKHFDDVVAEVPRPGPIETSAYYEAIRAKLTERFLGDAASVAAFRSAITAFADKTGAFGAQSNRPELVDRVRNFQTLQNFLRYEAQPKSAPSASPRDPEMQDLPEQVEQEREIKRLLNEESSEAVEHDIGLQAQQQQDLLSELDQLISALQEEEQAKQEKGIKRLLNEESSKAVEHDIRLQEQQQEAWFSETDQTISALQKKKEAEIALQQLIERTTSVLPSEEEHALEPLQSDFGIPLRRRPMPRR